MTSTDAGGRSTAVRQQAVRWMRNCVATALVLTVVGFGSAAAPAAADTSTTGTAVSFSVIAGPLSISAPDSAQTSGGVDSVTVDDDRRTAEAAWTTTVDFSAATVTYSVA